MWQLIDFTRSAVDQIGAEMEIVLSTTILLKPTIDCLAEVETPRMMHDCQITEGTQIPVIQSQQEVWLQFERTLIVAEEDSFISYLEGCTAPSYDKNQVSVSLLIIHMMNSA